MKFLLPITVLVGATWAAADYSRDSKDTRLSFSDFNNWSLPRLRTGSKRKTRRRTPELRNYLPLAPPAEKKDYMKFESSLQGEECEVPNPIEHGYDGIRRRGYEKVTEGVFCNKGAIEGSRCFLMCEKGARLENSGRKRFKCKCADGKCKWSINIEETICKVRESKKLTKRLSRRSRRFNGFSKRDFMF